jgi:hypothetical protein
MYRTWKIPNAASSILPKKRDVLSRRNILQTKTNLAKEADIIIIQAGINNISNADTK